MSLFDFTQKQFGGGSSGNMFNFNRPSGGSSAAKGTGIGGKFRKQYEKEVEAGDLFKNRFNPYSSFYNPELTEKRTQGADRLYGIGMSDELDPQAKAQLEAIRRRNQTMERGSREAIMQDAQGRGASSGTGSLLQQLINQQMGADRMSQEGTQTAANQWARSLNALTGGMDAYAGINRDALERARLEDAFDRFNIGGQADSLRTQGQLIADAAARRRKFLGGLLKAGIGLASGGFGGAAGAGSSIAGGGALDPSNFRLGDGSYGF